MQNQIPKNWQKVKLGEYASVKGGKRLPAGNSVLDENTGHPYLRIVDMREDGLDISRIKYISGEVFKKISQYTITDENLYISIAGTIGFVGKIPHGLSGANLTENCAKICNFSKELDRNFLLYFLRSSKGKAEIKAGTGGSSQPKLALSRIENFQVPLPPIELQKSIALILSSFDDKIEVNNKIAKTLEEMAQALFKEWFVKSNNSKSDGKFIRDVGQVKSGNRPVKISSKREINMTVPVYGANEIMGYTNDFLFDERVIITGRVGTIGKVFIINDAFWPSDNVLVILPKEKKYTCFLYFLLRRINFTSLNRGSSQPLITQGDLEKYPLPNFDEKTVENFHKSVGPFFDKLLILAQENQKLAALRDLFLPKLMRGEINIK